jgi:hypothetical protein
VLIEECTVECVVRITLCVLKLAWRSLVTCTALFLWKTEKSVCNILLCQRSYLPTYLLTYLWLYSPLSDLGRFFNFLILYTVGITPWTGDQPIARPPPTHRTMQTQNKRTQTSMPQVGVEPTIPAFERAKTVHALDRASTVIGVKCV